MKSVFQGQLLMLLAVAVFIGVGCTKIKKRENSTTVIETPGDKPNLQGGKGGTAYIRITPNHDGWDIDSCMVYIKYNSAVVPAGGVYDDSTWARKVDNKPVAVFDQLKPGRYYVYGKGWDLVRSEKVAGGLPYIIPENQSSTTHTLVLPIYDYR